MVWSNSGDSARYLADMAVQALLEEAELTPKPGLVDLRSSGSHTNMDISLMRLSAKSLHGCFETMGRAAFQRSPDQLLREELAFLGRVGEREMMRVTQGINTHRGAIWALGLLIGGAVSIGISSSAEEIAATAGLIAKFEDRYAPKQLTNGIRVMNKYGSEGAKGEAKLGFPHVVRLGLPILQEMRMRSIPEDTARLHVLLTIMANLSDSCLLHRGGVEALEAARQGALDVLEAGGMVTPAGRKAYQQLEQRLAERHVSPGGSADLLAAVLFLDKIQNATNLMRGGYYHRTAIL